MDPNINSLPVIEQYLQYYEYYSKLYSKVAILYQLGAHYNIFSIIDRPTNITDIHNDLNITLTCRDKSKPEKGSVKNPFLCGFPTVSLHDYLKKFLNCGYTVVEVIEDKSRHTGKGEYRCVSQIYTIGTYISEINADIHVVHLYINKNATGIGMSSININTGNMTFHESYSDNIDHNFALDEVNRFISLYNPQEIYYTGGKYSEWKTYNDPFVNTSSLDTFLERIYTNRKMLKIDNYLGVEMYPYAKYSIALLLHYLYTHNTSLLRNIRKPEKWDESIHLRLCNNTIAQLDICNNGKNDLLHILNTTVTKMGSRLFRQRLLNPSCDIDTINYRYTEISKCDNYEKYREMLRDVKDMDRDYRYIERECITPKDLGFFISSIDASYKILKFAGLSNKIDNFYKMLNDTYISSELQKYRNVEDISTNIFVKGVNPKIDKCFENIENIFLQINNEISKYPKLFLKLERLELGYYYKITTHKYKLVDFKHTRIDDRTSIYIRFGVLADNCDYIVECMDYINRKIKYLYTLSISDLQRYKSAIRYINNKIAEIDVTSTCRHIASLYKYSKPTIIEGTGYISAKNMRHPIIERISNNIYVPHTIRINPECRGLLIYGVNSSGKSSIMKSLGLNLIMAQAGMFVAASAFRFTPYTNIQTRILGNDNLYNGDSSFAVEMNELRGILCRSGPHSIVFGDEISRGTETISGTAIASTAIIKLLEKSTSFIFTTHLHGIVDIPDIIKCKDLGIYHMGITKKGRTIVYNRTLEQGAGDTLYGLEIAEAMDLPTDFISKCYEIRNTLLGESILGKKSRYNSKKIIDKCELCGDNAIDTHHIKAQISAIDNFIDHHHKNISGNLMGLCKKCHNSITYGKQKIYGYRDSTDGKIIYK